MTTRHARRSGITLTEILISILIMGVGLVSLATLFPLGLVRLRQASQLDRSSFLVESAISDLGTRDLLNKSSFTNSWYGFDPFVHDHPFNAAGAGTEIVASPGTTGGGLPICYDPLFRSATKTIPSLPAGYVNPYLLTNYTSAVTAGQTSRELRFGAGVVRNGANTVSYLRTDPTGGAASAHGLQRITNFLPYTLAGGSPWIGSFSWPFTYPSPSFQTVRDVAAETFASPEDVVFPESGTQQYLQVNPLVQPANWPTVSSPPRTTSPDLGNGAPLMDWKYTWFFTGRQTDVTNGSVFDGDVVVCDGRPLSVENRFSPITNSSAPVATGEIVLEAVFGFSSTVSPQPVGYSVGSDRMVLLRWPSSMPDPEIRIGSWIADVTYERDQATSNARQGFAATLNSAAAPTGHVAVHPMQRCYWYQIAKRGEPQDEDTNDPAMAAPVAAGWRRIVVYLTSPVKAKTLYKPGAGPVYLNAALFMPSVVNVFPRTVYSRNAK